MKFPNSRWFSKVLKEYKTNNTDYKRFICSCSEEFKERWSDYFFETKIKEYARKWIDLCGHSFIVGDSILFIECGNMGRKIRIDFLSWLIKELKKEELPSARWFKSVLKEFKARHDRFICPTSKKFRNKWNKESNFASSLKNKAKIWVERNLQEKVKVCGDIDALFYSNTYLLNNEMREIKIEFLSWLIKKLEK